MLTRLAIITGVAGLSLAAPEPVKYKIDQRIESRVDLSAFGQGEQVQNQAFVWFVSMNYSDSAGGTIMHVVLDSAQIDMGMMPVPQPSLDSLKGTVFHGWMDPTGRVQSLTVSRPSTLASQVEGALKSFHPRVKTGAKAGETWVDTLDVDTKTAQASTKTRTVSNYTMAGPETVEGVAATKVDATFTSSQTGTMETPAGAADLEGKASGTASFLMGKNGRYLGGKSVSSGEATISGAFAPAAIPVKTSSTTTVSVIK
jgi:hypothetical protein